MMLKAENQLLQSFQNPQQVSFGTFRKEKEKKTTLRSTDLTDKEQCVGLGVSEPDRKVPFLMLCTGARAGRCLLCLMPWGTRRDPWACPGPTGTGSLSKGGLSSPFLADGPPLDPTSPPSQADIHILLNTAPLQSECHRKCGNALLLDRGDGGGSYRSS